MRHLLPGLAFAFLVGCGSTTATGDASADATPAADVPADASPSADAPDAGDASLPPFSFFVTSMAAMLELAGGSNGFGGDLRFGETGAGAGLRGADKICATIAERSMPGAGAKPWRAFLSASADASGEPVNAIDRVGDGPWYDRLGRLVAAQRSDLLTQRPTGAHAAIVRDLPNEDGVPNHAPGGVIVDNHDTLTGSDTEGRLRPGATCADWTSTTGASRPTIGHSWPRNASTSNDSAHWMSAHTAPGCGAGVNITTSMGGGGSAVGGSGGYGGIYCFALTP